MSNQVTSQISSWLKSINNSIAVDALQIIQNASLTVQTHNRVDTIMDWLSVQAKNSQAAMLAHNHIANIATSKAK